MSETLVIDRLGHRGDGIAMTGAGPVYVPFALPGERVTVAGSGERRRIEAVLEPSALRRQPLCRHFGRCGGCQLQHLEAGAYHDWKRGLVVSALARMGIETKVRPLLGFPAASRRRAVFIALATARGPVLGFAERRSDTVVDIAECPVLVAPIADRLAGLRALAGHLAPRRGQLKLTVLACAGGLDVAATAEAAIADKAIGQAIAAAGAAGLARLSLDGEVLAQFRRPSIAVGIAEVTPPPGVFAQAVAAAEAAMAALVTAHLGGCRRVADLFCGFGAFALRLAEASEVRAADSDAAALAALDHAWRATGGRLKRLTAERRDLRRRPLLAAELAGCDGIVFDPPRAGAEAQARELAASGAGRIAAISCNPATLARDLRVLLDGGFRLASVTPIDQFAFTPHVEAVALLER
ncbi:MAG: RNA methyltransferase [Alphaproteobacteria bacterium]|nr:MAG: RNA methyltransferase [Alphaproteobacteria bacterium]